MTTYSYASLGQGHNGQPTLTNEFLTKRKPISSVYIASNPASAGQHIETQHVDLGLLAGYSPYIEKQHYTSTSYTARTLERSRGELFWLIFGDVASILIWTAAFCYAAILWYIDGKAVAKLSFDVHAFAQTTRLVSTLFTIIFAATVGHSLKNLILWRLERGNSIGVLDRLIGSTTVGGTIVTNSLAGWPSSWFVLTLILGLVTLWTFSPLGSQAVLRIISFQDRYDQSVESHRYLNTSRWEVLPGSGSDGDVFVIAPNALMNSAVMSPFTIKLASQDLWGNVRIPRLEALRAEADADGWVAVPNNLDYLDYSSLIGIPIGKFATPEQGFFTTSIESWYWNLVCEPWGKLDGLNYNGTSSLSPPPPPGLPVYDTNYTGLLYKSSRPIWIWTRSKEALNRTRNVCGTPSPTVLLSSMYKGVPVGNDVISCAELPARDLGISLQEGDTKGSCRLSSKYVESEVRCENTICSVKRMRASRKSGIPPQNWTLFDVATTGGEYNCPLRVFSRNIADAFASRSSGSGAASLLTGYMTTPKDPAAIFRNSAGIDGNYHNVTDSILTETLAQVFNTYWLANIGAQLIAGDWGQDFESLNETKIGWGVYVGVQNTSLLDSASVAVFSPQERVECDGAWLICFAVAILVALAMSIIGFTLALRTNGPRLGFNVSTMVRDNNYASLPSQRSYLDDGTRMRLAPNAKVMLGDVRPDYEVGHIALGVVDQHFKTRRVQKQRLYD